MSDPKTFPSPQRVETPTPPPEAARPLEQLDLEPIKAREVDATKGPWTVSVDFDQDGHPTGYGRVFATDNDVIMEYTHIEDCHFVAQARRDIPLLIAEVEQFRATRSAGEAPELERLRALAKQLRTDAAVHFTASAQRNPEDIIPEAVGLRVLAERCERTAEAIEAALNAAVENPNVD